MTDNDSSNSSNQERSWRDKKWRQVKDCFLDIWFFFLPGAVSKVHQQEANEKYWILWRDVEMLFNTTADELGIEGTRNLLHDPTNVDGFVEKEIERIEKKSPSIVKGVDNNSQLNDSPDKEVENNSQPKDSAVKGRKKLKKLLYFYRILVKDRARLTRREGHLNILWRDITFIRTRMLTDKIVPDEMLSFQLDYCIGEATRLGIQDNEEIKELIHQAAVEFGNSDSHKAPASNNRSVRNIVRILSRLNDRRLQRLHVQRRNKLMYQTAFLIFLALSCLLLHNHKLVLAPRAENNVCEEIRPARNLEKTASADKKKHKAETNETASSRKSWLSEKLSAFFVSSFNLSRSYMNENSLFFIFFAGLVGGFLSMVMRLGEGSKDSIPGDDAYYAWYALTKPVVGALGAAILYVIVRADFVPGEIFSNDYLDAIKCYPVGAKGFAFGCIMGFSERIIMPKVR
jgi:hypothetical protein